MKIHGKSEDYWNLGKLGNIHGPCFMPGWWYTYPSEKYDFVSGDDELPNMMGKIKNIPNHQPDHHHIPIVVGL